MPHQCTDCGRAFDDGSKEMLSGCPNCGGNTFQFKPAGGDADELPADAPEPPAPPESPAEGTVARTVGNAATTVRDLVGSSPPAPDPSPEDVPEPSPAAEDAAQASARSELVSPDELPTASAPPRSSRAPPPAEDRSDGGADPEPAPAERLDLADLRAELNDQFESVKVLEPGQYELNLMSLYDREEYIVALQEDGKYTIQVPERWDDS